MKHLKVLAVRIAQSKAAQGVAGASVAVASIGEASAQTAPAATYATAINNAFQEASANLGLGATGLITTVAVLTGLGLLVALLRK